MRRTQTTAVEVFITGAITSETIILEAFLFLSVVKSSVINRLNVFSNIELEKKTIESINNWYKDNNNDIFNKITNYICERIVGELYIKYDQIYICQR